MFVWGKDPYALPPFTPGPPTVEILVPMTPLLLAPVVSPDTPSEPVLTPNVPIPEVLPPNTPALLVLLPCTPMLLVLVPFTP